LPYEGALNHEDLPPQNKKDTKPDSIVLVLNKEEGDFKKRE
jgi:hypothetical protein